MFTDKPDNTTGLLQNALQHLQTGQLQQAEQIYRRILALKPDNAEANHLLGVIACQVGQFEAGSQLIRRAIQVDPGYAQAHKTLGWALQGMGRLEEAAQCLKKALGVKPDFAEAHNDLGTVLRELGQHDAAVDCFQKAIEFKPDLFIAHNNLGNILLEQGRTDEAIGCFQKTLALQPDFYIAYNNLGNALKIKRQYDEALSNFQKAIGLKPDYAGAHINLGATLQDTGRLDEAVTSFQKAIAFKPAYAEAHYNLALALSKQAKEEEALTSFRKALTHKPNFVIAHSSLLFYLNYLASVCQQDIYQESLQWDNRQAKGMLPSGRTYKNVPQKERRLRIGYVSGDFKDHSVAYFIEPVLTAHNRENVEICCYVNVAQPDTVTERLQASADHWTDISRRSEQEIADQINRDKIDILVDLAGHTKHNSLLVFARKPAPIQVTWLGYPNTTGMQTMDYRFTDAIADPAGEADGLYSETLIRLQNGFLCYQADISAPDVADPPCLEHGYITFGSFNNLRKMQPGVVQCWAQILHGVPDSHLLLKSKLFEDNGAKKRYLQMFIDEGIAAERLELYGRLPDKEDHLKFYSKVDIGLDPFPYNGTTTTCEALWMGVPVVTLLGERHSGRVGASIMHHVDLPELVADSVESYVQLAQSLANDQDHLLTIRSGLRQHMRESELMNKKLFTTTLEKTYRQLWANWRDNVTE